MQVAKQPDHLVWKCIRHIVIQQHHDVIWRRVGTVVLGMLHLLLLDMLPLEDPKAMRRHWTSVIGKLQWNVIDPCVPVSTVVMFATCL